MTTLRVLFLSAAMVRACSPANLAVSTYFKDGFTPAAIASDAQGNLLIAGSAVIDPASGATGVAVAKLDTKASRYLYLAYPDSAANYQVSAIAVDGAGNAYIAGWTSNPNFPVVGGGVGGTPWTSSHDERACYNGAPVRPLIVPAGGAGPIVNFVPGQPMPMIVWVTR